MDFDYTLCTYFVLLYSHICEYSLTQKWEPGIFLSVNFTRQVIKEFWSILVALSRNFNAHHFDKKCHKVTRDIQLPQAIQSTPFQYKKKHCS